MSDFKYEPGVFSRIIKDIEAGLSSEEAAARINTALGNKGCRSKPRTYNCPLCLDDGRVEVWHPACVYVAATSGIEAVNRCSHRSSDCACYCKRGEVFARLPRYEIARHCRVYPIAGASGCNCHPKALASLAEWIEVQRKSRSETGDPLFDAAGVSP